MDLSNIAACHGTGNGLYHDIKCGLRLFAAIALCLCPLASSAQEQQLLKLQADARVDYQREYVDGNAATADCGFKGRYVNLMADGVIGEAFSYSYRQRLIKANNDQSFFESIDWITLSWRASEHWELSAGKQIVGIGGYEYDRAPIDLYFCSEFWNFISCYQLGVSAAYTLGNSGKDKILAQVCQSPFRAYGDDMYAYNLVWYGSHGWLNTIYSVNMMEYQPDRYISYIALGHKLNFGRLGFELDLMNRAANHQTYFFKNCSFMGEVSYSPIDRLKLFGKLTYDVNRTNTSADYTVLPGTEITRAGGGLEFYPLKNSRNVRIHASYARSFGTNGNAEGAVKPEQDYLSIGLKWKVDLLSLKR